MKGFLKFLMWLIGVPSILILAFLSYLAYITDIKPYKGKKFDSAIWKQAEIDESIPWEVRSTMNKQPLFLEDRCGMYTDLVKNYIRKGMKVLELEQLLGNTELVSYCMHKDLKCLIYSMGPCYSGYTRASGSLVVCANKSQEVVSIGRSGGGSEYEDEMCDYNRISCFKQECACYFPENYDSSQRRVECPFEVQRW